MANAPSPNDLTRQQLDELDALLQRMLALPQNKPEPQPAPVVPVTAAPPGGWRADRPPVDVPPRTPHLTAPPSEAEDPAEVLRAVAGVSRSAPVAYAPAPHPVAPPPEPAPFAPAGPAVAPSPAVPFQPAEVSAPAKLFGPPTPDTGVPPSGTPAAVVDSAPPAPDALADFGPIDLPAAAPAPVADDPPPAPDAAAEPAPARSGGVPAALWPLFAANWVIEQVLALFGPPGLALTSPGVKHLLGGLGIILMVAAGVWTARGMGWIQLPVRLP